MITAPGASEKNAVGWRSVRDEALRRIGSGEWKPGDTIPHEAALAQTLGCSRSTVNRAMRALADAGLVRRKRKAGTRVVEHPERRAQMRVPLIREEIEAGGATYRYAVREVGDGPAPAEEVSRFKGAQRLRFVSALHFANETPFVLEDRWINLDATPGAAEEDFAAVSANEWLVRNAPFTGGEIAVGVAAAQEPRASELRVAAGSPLLIVARETWAGDAVVTRARLFYPPSYQMRAPL